MRFAAIFLCLPLAAQTYDLVISNARIVDGTGNPWFHGDLAIKGDRIARIAANDLHLQVPKGHVTEEVTIPFVEIKEIRLQHKDAKA